MSNNTGELGYVFVGLAPVRYVEINSLGTPEKHMNIP